MIRPPLNISKKKQLAIIVVFVGLPVIYCITWLMLSQWSFHQINKMLIETASQQRISIPLQLSRSGFPFSISWHTEGLQVATSLLDGELSLQFSDVVFGVSLLDPNTLNINAVSYTHLTLPTNREV